jgi:hypothetical protein
MSVSSVGSSFEPSGPMRGNDAAATALVAMEHAAAAVDQSLSRIASGTVDGNGVDTYA